MPSIHNMTRRTSRLHQVREAALLIFCEPAPEECNSLQHLSNKEWERLLHWLDTSGLALYFLDRVNELGRLDLLPPNVVTRLERNVLDNTERIGELISESKAIQSRFQAAGVTYATIKGFSLWPLSIPKLELRSQLDLDFLVAEESAGEARNVLRDCGYQLHAVSGKTWEFKANDGRPGSLKDMYKPGLNRSVELHIEPNVLTESKRNFLLSRRRTVEFQGMSASVLSPVDQFVGQGLHLYKHICSEFVRTAHVVEFRRHIAARYDDESFWCALHERISAEPEIRLRLGLVVLLISHVMGSFAPAALTDWILEGIPLAAVHWVELYGHRIVLASFPGSKMYLLLQKELVTVGLSANRSLRQALLPRKLPPVIAFSKAGESLLEQMERHRRQLYFILFRLRFHSVEGLRFLRESVRWRQYRNGFIQ